MECQKVKCRADWNKNWANSIKCASCTSSIFYASLDPRSYRLNKRDKNANVSMKKVIPRSVRLVWRTEK